MNIFIILIVVMFSQVYTYVKTYQAAILNMCCLSYVNFTSIKKRTSSIFYFLSILCNLDFIHVILSVSSQQDFFHQSQLNNFDKLFKTFKVCQFQLLLVIVWINFSNLHANRLQSTFSCFHDIGLQCQRF